MFLHFAAKMDHPFCFDAMPRLHLRIPFSLHFDISCIKHVITYSIGQLLHWYYFESGHQLFVRHQLILEKNHDDVFFLYRNLQTHKLVDEHFDIVDVIQQVVVFLNLAFEELVANEEDVGQIFCLVNIAKGLQASTGLLQLLICASWLSSKLRLMIDMVLFSQLCYSFNILESTLEGEASHIHLQCPKGP